MYQSRKSSDRTVDTQSDSRVSQDHEVLAQPAEIDEELLKQISGGGGEPDALPKSGW
jgi:hypothetical protein